jgi:type IV pilus assembly protein PilW
VKTLPQARKRTAAAAPGGVSLIEIMVALALGLVVVLAASLVFIGSRQANRTTEGLSRTQETARSSFELMARELREAGGNPCDTALLVANVLNNAQAAPAEWWVDWGRALQGFDGAAAFAGAAFGAAVGERVAGTDAVMAKYVADLTDLTVTAHDTAAARLSVNNNPHRARVGDLLMVCNYGQGALLQASAVGADSIDHDMSAAVSGNCSRGLGLPTLCTAAGKTYAFSPGAKVGRLVAVGWYIGNNGRADSGGRSLYRVTRNGAEEVAEGVADMQIEYLPVGAAAYVDADAVADWGGVVGMRIALTLQSAQTGVSTSTTTRLERPMSFTLYMRNRQP